MKPCNDENIEIERIWCGEATGWKLVARHVLSGLSAEKNIGFNEESRHRQELKLELSRQVSAKYPPKDFILEHACGPQGASFCLRHVPTGIAVSRHAGHESFSRFRREMMEEMFKRLRKDGSKENG